MLYSGLALIRSAYNGRSVTPIALHTGTFVSLSRQQVVDYVVPDSGCNAGHVGHGPFQAS